MDLAVYVDGGLVRRWLSIKHPPFVDRTRKWRRQSMNQAVCVDEGLGWRSLSIKHPPFVDRTRKWRRLSMDLAVYVDEDLGRRSLSIKHPPFVDRTRKWRRLSINQAVFVDGRLERRASGDDGGGLYSFHSLRPLPPYPAWSNRPLVCGGPLPLHESGGGHASSCHHHCPMNQPRQAATIHEIGFFFG